MLDSWNFDATVKKNSGRGWVGVWLGGSQLSTPAVQWQRVKYMHSKSQSYCDPNQEHPLALMRATAMLCRLKSLLSHSGECLWLSLEESSQGWREAVQGWREGGRWLDSRHLYSSLLVCDEAGKVRKARGAKHKHSGRLWIYCGKIFVSLDAASPQSLEQIGWYVYLIQTEGRKWFTVCLGCS